jgi:hypothetical protein
MSEENEREAAPIVAGSEAIEQASADRRPPHPLLQDVECVLANDGAAYALVAEDGINIPLRAGGKPLQQFLRERSRKLSDSLPKRSEMAELDYLVQAVAETQRKRVDVWYRVAPSGDGVEIDLGDATHERVLVTSEGVDIVRNTGTLFHRTSNMKSLTRPGAEGDLERLYRYCNHKGEIRQMLLAYVTYVIAHAKVDSSKFPILVITGSQGSGKTMLSRLIQLLIDPNVVAVQVLPSSVKDIAIATRNAHVVFYDNIRSFPPAIADALCVAATGGALTMRQLYTDADQHSVQLHGAIVLNGLHHFIDQPDLAQRSLHLHLPVLPEKERLSEQDMLANLRNDLPSIMRGLYELIAKILKALPEAKVTHPHRMYDFVRWLAAMEEVVGRPYLQEMFVRAQAQGQRDALLENLLSATVLDFAEKLNGEWSGTPSDLLTELTARIPPPAQKSSEWPRNAIALSRRLAPLQPALKEQGIGLSFSRGDERTITITNLGAY